MALPVDLFFTQTIDHDEENGFEKNNDSDEENEGASSGLISPQRKSYSRSQRNREGIEEAETSKEQAAKVRFHEFMKVVLIPTKEEYKKANCDLWWKRHDFHSFQKNANAELRLFSMIQNISVSEAKHHLYQPQQQQQQLGGENCAASSSSSTSISAIVTTTHEDVSQMMEDYQDDPFYCMDANLLFRRRSSEDEGAEDKTVLLDNLKVATQQADVNESTIASSAAITLSACSHSTSNRIPQQEEPHEPLNFCVAITDPVPASNNTRVSKYRNTIASAGILAAMGLFSFAAPIIGFYFLSSQR